MAVNVLNVELEIRKTEESVIKTYLLIYIISAHKTNIQSSWKKCIMKENGGLVLLKARR